MKGFEEDRGSLVTSIVKHDELSFFVMTRDSWESVTGTSSGDKNHSTQPFYFPDFTSLVSSGKTNES